MSFFTDTDSIYISSELFEKLEQDGFVGDELGKGKNDYGNGGIIYGLFLAPKIKYCLVLNNDYMIEEKKTFKGYVNKTISIEQGVGKRFRLLGHFGESRRRTRPEKARFLLPFLCAEDKMIMIKCSKPFEKKWNGLNPVIPKAEGHFEKDACF